MNLQPLATKGYSFGTICIRCNQLVWSCDHLMVDRDGCPLRSYFCQACALRVTAEEAAKLAAIARKLVHSNA